MSEREVTSGDFDLAFEVTAEERRAINTLQRLARRWPESLFIASMGGSLCVMRKGEDGMHPENATGGLDQRYVLDTIPIDNTGGDW